MDEWMANGWRRADGSRVRNKVQLQYTLTGVRGISIKWTVSYENKLGGGNKLGQMMVRETLR